MMIRFDALHAGHLIFWRGADGDHATVTRVDSDGAASIEWTENGDRHTSSLHWAPDQMIDVD